MMRFCSIQDGSICRVLGVLDFGGLASPFVPQQLVELFYSNRVQEGSKSPETPPVARRQHYYL